MAIIILPVCFIAILLNLGLYTGEQAKKRNILLGGALVFCAILLCITELLSAVKLLNYHFITLAWVVVTLAGTTNLLLQKNRLSALLNRHRQKTVFTWQRLTTGQKLLLLSGSLLFLLVFVQGIIYPPNNWDSMTYHLARITSWVSNQSVEPFATHITRQLYQPPLSEYIIMHFNVLNGADYFANSVQFIFSVFVLIAVAAITQQLKLSRKYQILTIIICATIPELLLQASSTQNDVVVAFFLLTTAYFAYKAVRTAGGKYFALTGIAAALALLSKGTAYIYLAPVLLALAVVIVVKLVRTRQMAYLAYGMLIPLIIVALNTTGYVRNYKVTGNILGVDQEESQHYANQRMSPALLVSSIVKNGAMHTGIKYTGYIAAATDSVLHKLHKAVGMDINDPAVNYRSMPYTTRTLATQEDSAPNLYHLILLLGCIIVAIKNIYKRRITRTAAVLFTILALQLILFCAYLKWQPWHSRLHLPLFIMAIPLIGYALSVSKVYTKVVYVLLPFMLLYAFTVVANNELRPFTTNKLKQDRFEKFFGAKPHDYPEYEAINKQVSKANYTNIGLILGIDDWQYPLFTDCYRRPLNPVHINVTNFSKSISLKPVRIDCIISTNTNVKTIQFAGHNFKNQTPGNKHLFLYK